MTAEEVFYDLYYKYGDKFNWSMIPFTNKSFVKELKREIGINHFLSNAPVWAVAKCDSNDDVLFLSGNEGPYECYYIFHLTYSNYNSPGFPKYIKLLSVEAVKEYLENTLS